MAAKFGKTRAQRVDDAFKELTKLRSKFGFEQVQTEQDIGEGWHMQYGMPHDAVARVKAAVRLISEVFGRIPWEHDNASKE